MRNAPAFARGALLLFLLLPLAVAAQPARATTERLTESGKESLWRRRLQPARRLPERRQEQE